MIATIRKGHLQRVESDSILGVDFRGGANTIFLTQIQSLRFLLHWYPPSLPQTLLPKCWERETPCYFLK